MRKIKLITIITLILVGLLIQAQSGSANFNKAGLKDLNNKELVAKFTAFKPMFEEEEEGEEEEAPEALIGERLFLETRFAQFFFANSNGDANQKLDSGDPVVERIELLNGSVAGPFAGQSINCRSCHLVDEFKKTTNAGMRTYADYARRTLVPIREDGNIRTVRNSPSLVNSSLARNVGFFLHFDGEFTSPEDLVKGTFTGRNFGWLANEKAQAIAHIANIIRNDNGTGALARAFGGRYSTILKGTDPAIKPEFRLPVAFRIDVNKATDEEILDTVAKLVGVYVRGLVFIQDERGAFDGSPYDMFLKKNNLPRMPDEDETDLEYSRRLLQQLNRRSTINFVTPEDGRFNFHNQNFVFGERELQGLRIFFSEPIALSLTNAQIKQGKIGNCIACHQAPNFTDFSFHNTGATQQEYDAIHGDGAFSQLFIPDLQTRNADYDRFLQPTPLHPNAQAQFLAIPSLDKPGRTDLGLWNVFANPDMPRPQKRIKAMLCGNRRNCDDIQMLNNAIALFKTPSLRDLGHSAPYLHTGTKDTLKDVVQFYADLATMARENNVRNGAKELQGIALNKADINAVAAFLQSLNEDYE